MNPVIKPQFSNIDRLMELISFFFVIVPFIIVYIVYETLPDQIPMHYDFHGVPDSFGPKWILYLIPSISLALYLFLTILNKYPHKFNYPTRITQENALRQYSIAVKLIRTIKMLCTAIFAYVVYNTIDTSNINEGEYQRNYTYLIFIGLIFIVTIFYLIKAKKSS